MSTVGPRRQARECALQVLFAADLCKQLAPEAVASSFDDILKEFTLPARARARTRELVMGVAHNLKQIDERIAGASDRWKLYRLATVDRNVLRISVYELQFEPGTPCEIVIDEALEVARRFASEESRSFVNGVLDRIARQAEPLPD
jgi:transcription antitermination protein NusB